MPVPTVIDLFAGCGGIVSCSVREGFNPIAAVEFDLAAAATYAAHFGEVRPSGDGSLPNSLLLQL